MDNDIDIPVHVDKARDSDGLDLDLGLGSGLGLAESIDAIHDDLMLSPETQGRLKAVDDDDVDEEEEAEDDGLIVVAGKHTPTISAAPTTITTTTVTTTDNGSDNEPYPVTLTDWYRHMDVPLPPLLSSPTPTTTSDTLSSMSTHQLFHMGSKMIVFLKAFCCYYLN